MTLHKLPKHTGGAVQGGEPKNTSTKTTLTRGLLLWGEMQPTSAAAQTVEAPLNESPISTKTGQREGRGHITFYLSFCDAGPVIRARSPVNEGDSLTWPEGGKLCCKLEEPTKEKVDELRLRGEGRGLISTSIDPPKEKRHADQGNGPHRQLVLQEARVVEGPWASKLEKKRPGNGGQNCSFQEAPGKRKNKRRTNQTQPPAPSTTPFGNRPKRQTPNVKKNDVCCWSEKTIHSHRPHPLAPRV